MDGAPTLLKLIDHPVSPYAQKIRILLREKGLPFECVTPSFAEGGERMRPGDFNPRSEIPVLLHDGAQIFDSTVILEYLEETFPIPPMMPATPRLRARARTIEEICDTHGEAITWGLGEVRFFKRGGAALAPVLRAAAETDVRSMYAWLQNQLGDELWLNGDNFGWGDIAALPFVTMAEMFGIAPAADSKLEGWLRRCLERPSVAITIAEARAVIPSMENSERLLQARVMKRQFRDHRLEWMIRAGGIQVVLDGLANDDIRFTNLAAFSARTDL